MLAAHAQRYDSGYDDYSQDNLYHDYAMKQQDKEAGKGWVNVVVVVEWQVFDVIDSITHQANETITIHPILLI